MNLIIIFMFLQINSYGYFFNNHSFIKYGISQNPSTKIYILVFENDQYFENICKNCDETYTNVNSKWCEICQKNHLKEDFISWTSENEKIDNLIQEMQLKIVDYKDTIFEWIPYNQFNDIKDLL